MMEIVNFLNDKGVRNMQGGKMTHSSVNTMLKNRRYIGELSFRDIVVQDAPTIIISAPTSNGARAATKRPCRKNGWKIWSSRRP